MTLWQSQVAFARRFPRLIDFCFEQGYEVVIGEVFRPPETAQLYAAQGRGSKNSLHTEKLAADILLFVGGKLLTKTESYRQAGEYWESLSTPDITCCWGGRFGDGNHVSALWQGRR